MEAQLKPDEVSALLNTEEVSTLRSRIVYTMPLVSRTPEAMTYGEFSCKEKDIDLIERHASKRWINVLAEGNEEEEVKLQANDEDPKNAEVAVKAMLDLNYLGKRKPPANKTLQKQTSVLSNSSTVSGASTQKN